MLEQLAMVAPVTATLDAEQYAEALRVECSQEQVMFRR